MADRVRLRGSSRLAHAKPQSFAYHFHNASVSLGGSASGIHNGYPLRLARRDGMVGVLDPHEESSILLLETILVALRALLRISSAARSLSRIATPRPRHTFCHVGVHQDGEFRLQVSAKHAMQGQHRRATQLPPPALVSFG